MKNVATYIAFVLAGTTAPVYAEDAHVTLVTMYECDVAARGALFQPFEEAERFIESEEGSQVLEFTETEGAVIREMVIGKVGCKRQELDAYVEIARPIVTKAIIYPDNRGIIVIFNTPVNTDVSEDT